MYVCMYVCMYISDFGWPRNVRRVDVQSTYTTYQWELNTDIWFKEIIMPLLSCREMLYLDLSIYAQLLVRQYEQEIKALKQELAMHDTLVRGEGGGRWEVHDTLVRRGEMGGA